MTNTTKSLLCASVFMVLFLALNASNSRTSYDHVPISDICPQRVETTSSLVSSSAFRMPDGMVNSTLTVPDSVDQNVKSGQVVMHACLGRESQVLGILVFILQVDYKGNRPSVRHRYDGGESADFRNSESYIPWLYQIVRETNFILEHEHSLSDSNDTLVRFRLK